MKHLLRAVLVLLAGVGIAHAAAIAENDQFQGQFDGGGAFSAAGFSGVIGGAGAGQLGYGYSYSNDVNDYAGEAQTQQQIQQDAVIADDGSGNFAGTGWRTEQNQYSGSAAMGGLAAGAQTQGIIGGAAGVSAGGVFGVAGSAGTAATLGGGFAIGNDAIYESTSSQQFEGVYDVQTVSPNGGFVYQTGTQDFGTSSAVNATEQGAGVAGAAVIQGGGSLVQNNGQGTYMEGSASAAGDAGSFAASVGNGDATAEAYGDQRHDYFQQNLSADGTSFQSAQGVVETRVISNSVSP